MGAHHQPHRLLQRYCTHSITHPWRWLLAYLLLTVVCAFVARGLRLETDLADLLPRDAPSVVALDEARQRTASSDQFVIALRSDDALANVLFVDALTDALQDWDEVVQIEVEQDRSFYRSRALLLLPVDVLRDIRAKLQRLIRRRLGQNNPLFIDLEREDDDAEARAAGFDPADVEHERRWRQLTYWVPEATLSELGMTEQEAGRMFTFLEDSSGSSAGGEPTMRVHRSELPDRYRDYRMSPDGQVALWVATLRGRATQVDYAGAAFDRGHAAIDAVRAAHPEWAGIEAEVVGAYRGFLEVRAVARDVNRATLLSVALVTLLLIVFFRSLRAVWLVLVPLLVGIVWTAALMFVLYGRMSTLTAFVFAMLIGMGIDFAIHLYNRAREVWWQGEAWDRALAVSISSTGRALLTATMTTVVALLMLLFARFDGFREFGVVCASGVAICFVSTVILLPPLVGAAEAVRPLPRPVGAEVGPAAGQPLARAVRRSLWLMLPLLAIMGWQATRTEFEYDFANLRGPTTGQTIPYGSAIGGRRGSAPVIILGRDETQMREVHGVLRERLGEDPMLRSFTTIETLVPSDQDARRELVDAIYETLDRRAVRNIDGDEGALIQSMIDLCDVEPFTADQLPDWIRRDITERDGTFGSIGQLFGTYDRWHALQVAAFQSRYQSLETSSGPVLLASNSFIVADVMRYVQADGRRLAWLVAAGLLLVLLLDFRRPGPALVCFFTLMAAALLCAGAMGAFGVRLGLYNMVVIPTVLGTGVDGAIHMYHRWQEEGSERLGRVLATAGASVLASSTTTVAGFVGLLFVSHKGVQTIGALAVTGIVCSALASVVLLPAVLGLWGRRRVDAAPAPRPPQDPA